MHHADFAARLLREIDERVANAEGMILSGAPRDWTEYRQAIARRDGLLIARGMIADGLTRDEARDATPSTSR